MNILNLRNVGSFEIPDSFRGILRISPNIVGNNLEDDPTSLLIAPDSEIKLSDSEGNELPLTFIPKAISTVVVDKLNAIDLINVTHRYKGLFIINSLSIKPTLNIKLNGNKIPLIFSNGTHSVGYPIEAPDDLTYFNRNNKFKFDKNLSYDENIRTKIPVTHELYTNSEKYSNQWAIVNGEYAHHYIQSEKEYHKVPILKKREYVLGTCKNHRYSKARNPNLVYDLSDDKFTSTSHTQLSYVPLETLLYSNLEADLSGIYRNTKGRYFNLNPLGAPGDNNVSNNNLAYTLFGNDYTPEALENDAKGPIMGIPVQSGTIHYNAIPARNYFFHLARRYNSSKRAETIVNNTGLLSGAANDLNTSINIIMRQYALCDGKTLSGDIAKNEYHNIDIEAFNHNFGDTHTAIQTSIGGLSGNTIKTPSLFECDQLSLRFIRGLNWLRTSDIDNTNSIYSGNEILNLKGSKDNEPVYFTNNTKKYKKFTKDNDYGNLVKDIHNVGMYYFNNDSAIQKNWKHTHLILGAKNGEALNGDELNKIKKVFFGEETEIDNLTENSDHGAAWSTYVKNSSPNTSNTFLGSYMLKTLGGISGINTNLRKKIQNYPVAAMGGSTSYMHKIHSYIRYGKRRITCHSHRTRWNPALDIKEGYYNFAHADGGSWRLLSSLPRGNKYGEDGILDPKLSTAKFGSGIDNELIINIDDTLGSPPAVNFIPLMKI